MDLAAAVAPTTLARQRTLPVADPFVPLLPDGALARGRAVSCRGIAATSLAIALAAEATTAGAWLAVVDVPWLGVEAAGELGVPLERLVGRRTRCQRVGGSRGRRPRRVRARRHPRPTTAERDHPAPCPGQGAGKGGGADRGRRARPAVRRHHDGGVVPGVGRRRAGWGHLRGRRVTVSSTGRRVPARAAPSCGCLAPMATWPWPSPLSDVMAFPGHAGRCLPLAR